jgi:hypothetical protein
MQMSRYSQRLQPGLSLTLSRGVIASRLQVRQKLACHGATGVIGFILVIEFTDSCARESAFAENTQSECQMIV